MKTHFDLSERIVILILLSTFIVRLSLPGFKSLVDFVVYIQIILFLFFIITKLDFNKLFEFRPDKFLSIDKFIFASSLLYIFSVFVVNISTSSNFATILKTFSYVIVIVCFFYYFPKILFKDSNKFEIFTDFIFYIASIIILIGLAFWISGYNPIQEYSGTTSGLFAHPNTASMFLTIVIPVIIYKFFVGKIPGIFFTIILGLALISVLFTFSRAGYIGVGVGLLIYTYNKSKKLFVFIAILITFVASTIVFEFATMKTDSSLARILLMYTSISMITENQSTFLWGYGPVNAFEVFNSEKFFFGDEDVADPHNVFLLLAIQFGVLFTVSVSIAFFILLYKVLKLRFLRIIEKEDHRFNLSVTIIVSLLFQNMLEDMIVYPEVFFMPIFLIFTGILYYYYKSHFNFPYSK